MLIKHLLEHKTTITVCAFVYTVVLLVLSFSRLEKLPDTSSLEGDKVFHFLAYTVFTALWFFALKSLFKFNFNKTIWLTIVVAFIFGIIVEYLQNELTTFRSADVKDVIANTLGILATSGVMVLNKKRHVKK